MPKAAVDQSISEVKRVLRAGGIFGLGMIEGESEDYRQSAGVKKPRWFSYYSEKEVRSLLEKHDFEVIYFEKFQPGSHHYLNFICRQASIQN